MRSLSQVKPMEPQCTVSVLTLFSTPPSSYTFLKVSLPTYQEKSQKTVLFPTS